MEKHWEAPEGLFTNTYWNITTHEMPEWNLTDPRKLVFSGREDSAVIGSHAEYYDENNCIIAGAHTTKSAPATTRPEWEMKETWQIQSPHDPQTFRLLQAVTSGEYNQLEKAYPAGNTALGPKKTMLTPYTDNTRWTQL